MRTKDMVRQILSFSRKSETEQKPLNIAPVVTESLKLLRASIPASVDIRRNISIHIDNILEDSTQIHQILLFLPQTETACYVWVVGFEAFGVSTDFRNNPIKEDVKPWIK